VRFWITAFAILMIWSLVVALCAPAVGRYLAKLDQNRR
jgi:hypothetical protein